MSHTYQRDATSPRFQVIVTPFDLRVSQAMREIADGKSRRQIIERHGSIVMEEALHKIPLSSLVKM